MPNQTASPPESITELQGQLVQFRSTHPPRTKLPQSLWQSAAELARCHGLYVVARSLKLDYGTLKKHVMGIRFTQVTPIDCGFALVAIGWTIRA